MTLDHVQQGAGLNGRHLAVVFQVDLVPGAHLRLGEDGVPGEKIDVLFVNVGGHTVHRVPQIGQAPALGLLYPGVIIAVAVEDDALVGGEGVVQQGLQRGLEVVGLFQNVGELAQLLGHNGVQHHIRAGDGLRGAQHTELEFVTGKGQGRGAVAVCGVLGDLRKGIYADGKLFLGDVHILSALNDGIKNSR